MKILKQKGDNKLKLTIKQVADEMEVNPMTVRRWIESGRLKAIKPFKGARITVEKDELDKFKKGEN